MPGPSTCSALCAGTGAGPPAAPLLAPDDVVPVTALGPANPSPAAVDPPGTETVARPLDGPAADVACGAPTLNPADPPCVPTPVAGPWTVEPQPASSTTARVTGPAARTGFTPAMLTCRRAAHNRRPSPSRPSAGERFRGTTAELANAADGGRGPARPWWRMWANLLSSW